jgi:hypothetical protein
MFRQCNMSLSYLLLWEFCYRFEFFVVVWNDLGCPLIYFFHSSQLTRARISCTLFEPYSTKSPLSQLFVALPFLSFLSVPSSCCRIWNIDYLYNMAWEDLDFKLSVANQVWNIRNTRWHCRFLSSRYKGHKPSYLIWPSILAWGSRQDLLKLGEFVEGEIGNTMSLSPSESAS